MKCDPREIRILAPNPEPDYRAIVFECRDLLNCGHVVNVPDTLRKMRARYNDALARIAQLESAALEVK